MRVKVKEFASRPFRHLNLIAEYCCKESMIRHLFWLNSVDSAPIQNGLDSSQVEKILITGFGILVHVNRICIWGPLTPYLCAKSHKQYIHSPVMRR